ncbi:FAS1-like dehydratase domain-containing protein, partial [Novosphingobium sp. B 225]|uniref:FAS1-like dehydratase domain-containing protein n=1 Tax=Novosphingobium sp. B 225 TaxID=1961849 RepID=UPI00159589C9
MSEWQDWIGRTETRTDRADPAMVIRWLATLDRTAPADGTVPQALHWCLGLPDAPTAELGEDGHPRRDDSPASFLPPLPLPRRMWASSKIEFLAPLRMGEAVTRKSRVQSIAEKAGGSGRLIFVEIEHETSGEGGPAVREVQSLVYREPSAPGTPPAP